MAKKIVLGLLNGKTEYSIHQDLSAAGINLPLDQMRSLIAKFHDYFSGLRDWQDQVLIKAVDDGYAQTALTRRRYLEKFIREPSAENKIKNHPIQATAADGCSRDLGNRILRVKYGQNSQKNNYLNQLYSKMFMIKGITLTQ